MPTPTDATTDVEERQRNYERGRSVMHGEPWYSVVLLEKIGELDAALTAARAEVQVSTQQLAVLHAALQLLDAINAFHPSLRDDEYMRPLWTAFIEAKQPFYPALTPQTGGDDANP